MGQPKSNTAVHCLLGQIRVPCSKAVPVLGIDVSNKLLSLQSDVCVGAVSTIFQNFAPWGTCLPPLAATRTGVMAGEAATPLVIVGS